MKKGQGKTGNKAATDGNKPVEKHGPVIQGFFLVKGISALVNGSWYVNKGDEVCPWSPGLPNFLFAYGIVNVSLPALFILILIALFCVAYFLNSKDCASRGLEYILYIPVLSLVINFGLITWDFVLLFSNSESVTYDQYNFNSIIPNKNYCGQSIYITSMVVAWWYVAILLITMVFFFIRYIRSKMGVKRTEDAI